MYLYHVYNWDMSCMTCIDMLQFYTPNWYHDRHLSTRHKLPEVNSLWPTSSILRFMLDDIYIYILVGGWAYPSEKYEFVSWDDDIPNIWKNKIHVPNHQSVYLHCKISKDIQYCTTNSCWSYPPFKLLLSSQTLEVSPIGQRTADLCSCWSTPGGLPKAIDGDLMWFNVI